MSTPGKRSSTRRFFAVFLLAALLLAGVASYYASSHPDGLNFVAEKTGFIEKEKPSATSDGPLAGYSTKGVETTLASAVQTLLGQIDEEHGYLAVMAYVDRVRHARLADVREQLAAHTGRPTTFGWGPRFLHSTGQYHKGGPPTGVYLQVTAEPLEDLEVPGRPFTFGTFIRAQAIGDANVLAEHGRPVLRLHLTDQKSGLDAILEALG